LEIRKTFSARRPAKCEFRARKSPPTRRQTRYFATAVKLSVIDEYETLFETQGWQAGLILPRAVSEANWLIDKKGQNDSLAYQLANRRFTALLLRGDEPTVVRSVTCTETSATTKFIRLLMFYRDRFGKEQRAKIFWKNFLSSARDFAPAKIREIAAEALGRTLEYSASRRCRLKSAVKQP
jgi:hypothetical protein